MNHNNTLFSINLERLVRLKMLRKVVTFASTNFVGELQMCSIDFRTCLALSAGYPKHEMVIVFSHFGGFIS